MSEGESIVEPPVPVTESRDIQWVSEALDSGDKGISKSATMARKDVYRTLLLVPGGAENEADETDRTPERPAQANHEPPKPAPPSEAQRSYLRQLARQVEHPVVMPTTAADASTLIDQLKAEVSAKTPQEKTA